MAHIVDLSPQHETAYLACLEEWSEEMKEAGSRKARWLERMRGEGLRVKLAIDDRGHAVGMIQYVPAAHAPIYGHDLYFVQCIWVHGHRAGVGDQQGHGYGAALLAAAEADARALGAKGMAAWGLRLPLFMRASWFKKHGYEKADTDGMRVLLVKRFVPDVPAPAWLRSKKRPPDEPGKVVVTLCGSGWCQAGNITFARARRVASHLGVEVHDVDTCRDRAALEAWGTDGAVFVDDRPVLMGPPVSERRLAAVMSRHLRRKMRRAA